MYDYIRRFGFGSKTGIELPGETVGIVRKVERLAGVVDRIDRDRSGNRCDAGADGAAFGTSRMTVCVSRRT